MDKESAITYIIAYYRNNLNVQNFFTEYANDRGKTDLTQLNNFIAASALAGILDSCIKYAINWYIAKYNIHLIHQINKNTNQLRFITAY